MSHKVNRAKPDGEKKKEKKNALDRYLGSLFSLSKKFILTQCKIHGGS